MNPFGTPLSQALNELARFELLQVGDTGSGKTTRALTATSFGPMYFFDLDGKIGGAARTLPEEQKNLVSYDNYKDKDFDQVFARLKELKALYKKGETPFATIVVDTFTMLNEKAYVKAMGKKLETNKKAEFAEWGAVGNDLLNFFKVLHSFPCNTIVNAHVSKTENAEGKQVLGVEGMGSYRNKLPKAMTDSHYLYFELGKFNIKASKSGALPANSNIDPKYLDPKGNVTVPGLEIFQDYAYKIK